MPEIAAPPAPAKRPYLSGRTSLSLYLKLAATIAILAVMARSIDSQRFYHSVWRMDPRWLFAGCLGSVVFVALRIVKWTVLTRANGLRAGSADITRAMLIALAVGLITPARIGEVVAVAPFSSADRPKAVFAYIYDRVCELCVVLMFSIPAALMLLGRAGIIVGLGIFAGCLFGIGTIVLSGFRARLSRLALFDRFPKLRQTLACSVVAPPSYWALCVLAYVVAYAIIVFFIVGAEPLRDWRPVLILPVVTLSNLISITVGGLGVREGLAAALAPRVALIPEVSAAAFFLSFVATRLVPGAVGLAWSAMARMNATSRSGPIS